MNLTCKKIIYEKYINENFMDKVEDKVQRYGGVIGMGMPAVGAAMSMAFSAKDAIQRKMMEYKWKKKGCDQEINPQRKQQCEIRHRNMLIASIAKEKGRCRQSKDPQACQQQIDHRINALRGQNAAEYGE